MLQISLTGSDGRSLETRPEKTDMGAPSPLSFLTLLTLGPIPLCLGNLGYDTCSECWGEELQKLRLL